MNLRLVGLNHRTAPLEVRERLHVGAEELRDLLVAMGSHPEVRECFILSTCNRVEVLADLEDGRDRGGILAELLCRHRGQALERIRPHLYSLASREAVAHVFRVAASLDSLVVGEPQIIQQVRAALAAGRAAGTVGPVLGAVLDKALAVAKRVRRETGIGRNPVSISTAAVELARRIFGELAGRRALLLGAGEMAELAARQLVKRGLEALRVANRSPHRAARLAEALDGMAVAWGDIPRQLEEVDIVISSTSSPGFVVEVDAVRRALPRRRYRPIFFIDIAVPRDIDAAVNDLDNVYLYDIDDLGLVVERNRAARAREAQAAEAIISGEVSRFMATVETWRVAPTIAELRRAMEELRAAEMDRLRRQVGGLTDEQRQAIEATTRSLVNRLLHPAIEELKRAARAGNGAEVARIVRRLYGLGD